MKKLLSVVIMSLLGCISLQQVKSQSLFDRVKQKAKDKLNQHADNATDKGLNQVDPANKTDNGTNKSATNNTADNNGNQSSVKTIAAYKNYDFVPGDKIIFQSELADESVGEIPSQFTINEGQADVQMEDGVQVIHVPKGAFAQFTPRLKNAGALPSQFTIEFDYKNENYGVAHVHVNFGYHVGTYGPDDVMQGIGFNDNYAVWTLGETQYPQAVKEATSKPMEWHHIAIAINGDAGKAYVDQYRVSNVNNLKGKPKGIFFEMIGYENSYIKNVRIAEGGVEAYKKITTNNKIITHGILFAVDEATIEGQSMGTINSIYNLMQKDPSLKFEIDGHTDNSGAAAHNLTLSQLRAEAVKKQLLNMGIDAGRLNTKGFGDTKPLGTNDTPEGKANNRRVEFVKM